MKKTLVVFISLVLYTISYAQTDTTDLEAVRRMVNLSEVVVRSNLNIPNFLWRVKNDTTFYKAFKNLRVLSYSSLNDIRMEDKGGKIGGALQSRTRQTRANGCRTMKVLDEKASGNIYDKNHQWNYYTAELYASLFFTTGVVCGETNTIKGVADIRSKSGLEKHKEQLKMLFFNPGKKIPGIPFIGNKLDVFDKDIAQYYDYVLDQVVLNGKDCYLFSIKAKEGLRPAEKDHIVFDNLITWFDAKTMEVVSRSYDLSYNATIYDFNVHVEVQMTKIGDYLVPQLMRYNGNWDVPFKKRERGIFTATLFDFAQGN